MARRSYRPEQIIKKLREAEVLLSQGSTVGEAAKKIGVNEQTTKEIIYPSSLCASSIPSYLPTLAFSPVSPFPPLTSPVSLVALIRLFQSPVLIPVLVAAQAGKLYREVTLR